MPVEVPPFQLVGERFPGQPVQEGLGLQPGLEGLLAGEMGGGVMPPYRKALPPPTFKFPEANIEPTLKGPWYGEGMGVPTGARSLPPASQHQVPGFSVADLDLVPYKNPTTGQIEYAPRWWVSQAGANKAPKPLK